MILEARIGGLNGSLINVINFSNIICLKEQGVEVDHNFQSYLPLIHSAI